MAGNTEGRRRGGSHAVVGQIMKDIICLLSAHALVFAAKDEVYPQVQLRRHLWRLQRLCKLCCKICRILCPRRQLHIANFCPCNSRELLPLCLGSPTSETSGPARMAAFFKTTTNHGLSDNAIRALVCSLRSPMLPCKEAMHSHLVLSQPPGRDASPDVRSPKSTPLALTRNKWSDE